ncbi:hypothetical protein NE857_03900 [Nocardiopsis exhalans]|uniref:Integral membrane protein n=1 Tax=Nocardiopsis exhalans TaxID=163604 RepID=A0ABY5D8Z4_9ACTN|nr:hypothetical protein [Nocardiopsis exhalans]USY20807.1 hypothetical protein NE857_03900 [Nocardiopsis exhalans]
MSTSPMPRALRVVRALLYIKVTLTLISAPLMLIGIAVMTEDEVFQEMGTVKAAAAAFTVAYFALALFELYVVVTLRRGGRTRQRYMRVLVGLHLLFALAHLLTGGISLVDIAIGALLLTLNESRSARNWYRSGTPAVPTGTARHVAVSHGE